jgi:hypothetical protein
VHGVSDSARFLLRKPFSGEDVAFSSPERDRHLEIRPVSLLDTQPVVTPDRGRDGDSSPPPAQIRTGPTKASGSYLGCVTAKRTLGHG